MLPLEKTANWLGCWMNTMKIFSYTIQHKSGETTVMHCFSHYPIGSPNPFPSHHVFLFHKTACCCQTASRSWPVPPLEASHIWSFVCRLFSLWEHAASPGFFHGWTLSTVHSLPNCAHPSLPIGTMLLLSFTKTFAHILSTYYWLVLRRTLPIMWSPATAVNSANSLEPCLLAFWNQFQSPVQQRCGI